METLTRQDVQNAVEQARSKLQDQLASRQDVQSMQDSIKALTVILQQNQQMLKQGDNQFVQMTRRITALESRMIQVEHELQELRRSVGYIADHPPEKITERVLVTTEEDRQRLIYTSA